MKKTTTKPLHRAGEELYEEWMDYKNLDRRASVSTLNTVDSVPKGKYRLHDEYHVQLSRSPSLNPTPLPAAHVPHPLPDLPKIKKQGPTKPRNEVKTKRQLPVTTKFDFDSLDEETKAKILKEFGPFYNWVRNGRTDDIKREIIEGLLFQRQKL